MNDKIEIMFLLTNETKKDLDDYIKAYNAWASICENAIKIVPGDYDIVLQHFVYDGIQKLKSETAAFNTLLTISEVIAWLFQ